MLKKESDSRNYIRLTLAIITITLFLAITSIFFISISYFDSIHTRISKLISLTNYKDASYEDALSEFLEAESEFRKFSVDLDSTHYRGYIKHIDHLDNKIQKIVNNYRNDSSVEPLDPSAVIGFNRYLLIQSKIQDIKGFSKINKSYDRDIIPQNQHNFSKNIGNTESEIILYNSSLKSEISLLDKIFGNHSADSIDKNVLRSYNEQLRNFSKSNYKRFNAFKNSYEILRNSERNLMSEDFGVLYSIYQALLELDELQVIKQKKMLQDEHKDLLSLSEKITWQIVGCLVFIFILIFIMIFYQFRNRYYEKKLVQEQEYASQLASEKSDILAEISHEIRTPINSLIGIIDILRKRSNIYSDKEKLFLDSAYSNITNTSRTINDILNLSKIDNQTKLEFKNFDIEELANDVFLIHKSHAEIKSIDLQLLIPDDTPTIIHSDELKLRQILTNLISNAIKYTIAGQVTCHIYINELNNLVIKVNDTGVGISEQMQSNIFKKYFTKANEDKMTNGIGLGLYITNRLVNQLNGKITFSSKLDVGTSFAIELPIPQAKFNVNKNKFYTLTDLDKKLSWLIVDDNILNVMYLKQFFFGFESVVTASNGLEALEILEHYIPDIIITDINMPIMTGDELLVAIRKLPNLCNTKVFATSSDYEQIKELEIKRNVYFDNIITKPFTEKDLAKTIFTTLSL